MKNEPVIVDLAGVEPAPSVQAQRREREIERLKNAKSVPPLTSPLSTQVVGVTFHDYPGALNDIRDLMDKPTKAEYDERAGSYPNFGGDMAQMSAENDYEQALERGFRVTQWIELRREPHNAYDENAIAVWWDGIQLGHINKALAFRLAPELDAGTTWLARVEEVNGSEDMPGISIRLKRED